MSVYAGVQGFPKRYEPKLAELFDVDAEDDPADGEVVSWNAETGKFEFAPVDPSAAVALAPSTSARNVIQATAAGVVPLTARGAVGQTANLMEWQGSTGIVTAQITPALNAPAIELYGDPAAGGGYVYPEFRLGRDAVLQYAFGLEGSGTPGDAWERFFEIFSYAGGRYDIAINDGSNSGGNGEVHVGWFGVWFDAQLSVYPRAASRTAVKVRGRPAQTGDLTQWQSSAAAILSRFNKDGYFMTRKVAAPAAADLVAGELAVSLDQTVGDPKVVFTAKDSAGTVFSAELPMVA